MSCAKDSVVVSPQKKFIGPFCYFADQNLVHGGIKHRSNTHFKIYDEVSVLLGLTVRKGIFSAVTVNLVIEYSIYMFPVSSDSCISHNSLHVST